MKKRIIAVLLALALILTSGIGESGFVKAADVAGEAEQEIPEGYTPIYDIADLYGIRNNVDGNYILMNDIDMTEDTSEGGDYDCGTGWDSIEKFKGVLDGNGHRIIGMHIFGKVAYGAKIGLFENPEKATIKNLGMVNCDINVINSDEDETIYVGSIAGNVLEGSIANCYSSGKIKVQGTGFVGGVAGCFYDMTSYGEDILDCYNICEIDALSAKYTGGIVGYGSSYWTTSNTLDVVRCYNAGIINGNEESGVGAICGNNNLSTKNCFYLKGTASYGIGMVTDTATRVSLSENQMKNEKLFIGYDFTNTWEIDPYCSYPYPQLKKNRMIKVSSINLANAPQKLTYQQGESLEIDGTALEISYDDGVKTSIPLAMDMLSGYDMMQIGMQTVDVSYGGQKTAFEIEVKEIPISSITIPEELSIYRSKEYQLNPTIVPENASDKSVSWESSNMAVATVDNSGLVKAKSEGMAVITATTSNGLEAKCTVTVLVPAVSIQLSQTAITLKEGESHTTIATVLPLESTDIIKWKSDNTAVAEIFDGVIVAKSAGTATITAYTESGIQARCTVTVQALAVSIQLSQTSVTLKEGASSTVTATVLPLGCMDAVLWKSGNTAVAEVYNGVITAKKAGTAVITAYTASGIQETCIVTVQQKDTVQNPGSSGQIDGSADISQGSNTNNNAALISKTKSTKAKIKSVKNVKTRGMILKLGSLSGCDGYQIQYGLKKNFKGAKSIKKKSSSVTVKKLKLKKIYYVRVRGYKKISGVTYYGKWSARKTVKIKK